MKYYFVGNWKMNMLEEDARAFTSEFLSQASSLDYSKVVVGLAPPITTLPALREACKGSHVQVGCQNVHWLESGAHTGELSAAMVAEAGAQFAIVGHSERRQYYAETDETVSKRAQAALRAGLWTIVCIGETEAQFKAEQTEDVVKTQLKGSLDGITSEQTKDLVIAYEPVWAIGTGLTATPEIAGRVHDLVRSELEGLFGVEAGSHIPIQYGGSAKPDNITDLCAQSHVNGALVGGASLKATSFYELVLNGLKS